MTHGISHLHKCEKIIVVSRGEIIDEGSYDDLINTSKILREFVQSTATSDNQEQYQCQISSVPASPEEPSDNPLIILDNDLQQDQLQSPPNEIEEEKKKLIQKETVQTGSVSSIVCYLITFDDGIYLGEVQYFFNLSPCL